MNIKKISLALLLTSTLFTPMAYAMDNDEKTYKSVANHPAEKDAKEKIYKDILKSKDSSRILNLANLFLKDGVYEKAFLSLQEVEKLEGNTEVLFQLGKMCEEGTGVEKDEQKGEEYCKKAFSLLEQNCEKHDSSAIADLILIYNKLGTQALQKEEFEKGTKFYLKQARLMGKLANMYEEGKYIEQDSKAAMNFYGDQRKLYLTMYREHLVHFDEIKKLLVSANNGFFRLQKEIN